MRQDGFNFRNALAAYEIGQQRDQSELERLRNHLGGVGAEPMQGAPVNALAAGGHHPGDGHNHGSGGLTPAAIAARDRLAQMYGDVNVISGYRDPERNRRVGGAKNSQHVHGNAFDYDVSGLTPDERYALINAAYDAGFTGVGVYDNSLHFDVGPQRAWGPDFTNASIPAEYRPYLR